MIKRSECHLSWHPNPTTWLSLLLVVLLFPLGLTLPPWWGWENGPIENTQVVILAVGVFVSFFAARNSQEDRQIRGFWLWQIPIWMLLIGRELSWGRVFYPVAIGTNGPSFLSIHQLWYGQFVYPLIAVVTLISLLGLWHNFNRSLLGPKLNLPAIDILLLTLAAIAAQFIFEKTVIIALKPYAEVLEELAELIVYWCLVSIAATVGFAKRQRYNWSQVKKAPPSSHLKH